MLIWSLLGLPLLARGDVYDYGPTKLNLGAYLVRRVEMYSPKDSPSRSAPGNGNAFIQMELKFHRNPSSENTSLASEGVIEIATVKAMQLEIGYKDAEGTQWWCCTSKLADKMETDHCDQNKIDTLIIRNNDVRVKKVNFHSGNADATASSHNARFGVEKSGPHIMVMSNCDARLREFEVSFKGQSLWMNPYGYLPATLYAFLPFYGSMSIVFGALALVWLVLNAIYWKDIVKLQNYITAVLTVCLLENMVLYFDYANFNATGRRHEVTLFLGILITMLRRTISRMLIMAVSIGFAIVRPDLGKNKRHILNFGVIYFVLGLTQQILIDLAKVHTGINDHWRTLLSIPVAAADSGCYWFIFISLYHLITMLRVRQQLVKLAVYKTFTKVLVFSLVCATVFSIYHLYLTATRQVLQHWRIWWLLDEGIWNILFSVIFLAICFLFRPSQSAKRYAYSQLSTDMADDEYGLEDDDDHDTGIEMAPIPSDENLFSLGDEDIGEPVVDKKSAKVD